VHSARARIFWATKGSFEITASGFLIFLKQREASVLRRTALDNDSNDIGGAKVNPALSRRIRKAATKTVRSEPAGASD